MRATRAKAGGNNLLREIWRARVSYFFLLPTFLFLAVFNYFPALSGLFHAFTEWELSKSESRWIGLENFRRMAADDFLIISVWNQVILLIASLLKGVLVPLAVAEMIFHLKSTRLQYSIRTLFLTPMVVPGMVGVLLWGFIYDPNVGLLNGFLDLVGLGDYRRAWLGDWRTAIWSLIGIGLPWVGGMALLIYLAALMGIPQDLLDSSAVDGASGMRRIWSIDIPFLRPQIGLITALTLIGALQDYTAILVLTGGGPGLATHVPALHMYLQAMRFGHFGYAAAIGLVLFVLILLLSLLSIRFSRDRVEMS